MKVVLHDFPGGVKLPGHKSVSTDKPIATPPLFPRYIVPLRQHIGHPAKPVIAVGDRVLRGEMIGAPEGTLSAAVHSPTSGTVSAIEARPVPHPSGMPDLCIVIESDGDDRSVEMTPLDYRNMNEVDLRENIRNTGLAGLGGAVFPSSIKLNPGAGGKIPLLIIDGGECEPWITCDDMLMREQAAGILSGSGIMRFMLKSEHVLVGIEDDKPEAFAAMRKAAEHAGFPVEVVAVPARYPAGGAKQMIQTLTGEEVPSGRLSTDIGIQLFNVGTAYALHRAIELGEPLLSRIVTVTGHVRRPQNFNARIGTPIEDLLKITLPLDDPTGWMMGGPMMGVDLTDSRVPVVKAMNCLIAKSAALFPPLPPPLPCIRCTRCAEVCPARLQPQDLYLYARAKNFGRTQELRLFDCIECGCCSYVCPSHIPLVHYYRFAKNEIWVHEAERKAADTSRERHEFRQFRLEREKQEKHERLAQKAAERLKGLDKDADAEKKKAAIRAAMERARKAKEGITPRNMENLPPEKRQEIAEIEARRNKLREIAKKPLETEDMQ
jgi:H+/Na+-translocating ferredoxin:NAD+ oxidoreductase subunit C